MASIKEINVQGTIYNAGRVHYGECTTAAATTAKVVTCSTFTAEDLVAGAVIIVKNTTANSGAVASLTMNVNGTGAKPIKKLSNASLGNLTNVGEFAATAMQFLFDGTNWVLSSADYNSTYSNMSQAEATTGTATSARAISAKVLNDTIDAKVSASESTIMGAIPEAGTSTPIMDGTAAVGASTKYAREDHVHPKDTTKANLASPTFTGTPKAPTAATTTNNTQIATTEFVQSLVGGQKGSANGLAELDSTGKVPSSQLPAYVDDVLEYASKSAFPTTGETGKIYIAQDDNKTYRWGETAYVEISPSLALGETSSTAYRGDRGKVAYDHASAKGSAYTSGLYKITTNDQGHVTAATAVVKDDITALGIPGSNTDTKVTQTVSDSSNVDYPVLTKNTAATATITDTARFSSKVTVNPSTGNIKAVQINGVALGTAPKFTDTTYGTASTTTNGLMSSEDKTKLNGIATGAEVNQNAFSNVKVGNTTVAAETKTDTLELVGSNVTLTPDATNDKVTIGITSANVTTALGFTPANATAAVTNVAYDSTNKKITKTVNGTTTDVVTVATLQSALSLTKGDVGLGNVDNTADADKSVKSAGTLTTGRAIDGVTFNGSAAITHYGTCGTAAATAAKTVACTSYTLVTGSRIIVKFTVTNTAANPTLNVNSTGAKAIQYRGAAISAGYLAANRTYEFIYDGTNYQLVGDLDTNTANTDTYPTGLTWTAGTTAGPVPNITRAGTTTTSATGSAIPAASGTASGIVTTGAQTFAGTKTIKSPKVWDTRYPELMFHANSATGPTIGEIWYDVGATNTIKSNRMSFRQYSPVDSTGSSTATSGFHETYSLPTVTVGMTTNATYHILTSKSAVTIAQGGTGATTAAAARTNLGLGTAATMASTAFKAVQTAKSDPTASGTGVAYIASISQDAQGVITATKSTVRTYVGATSTTVGTTGLVPAGPTSGYNTKFLRADGTWVVPTNTDTKVTQTAVTADTTTGYNLLATSATGTSTTTAVFGSKVKVYPEVGSFVAYGKAGLLASTLSAGYKIWGTSQAAAVGGLFHNEVETSTTVGTATLQLGNERTLGTADNAKGRIILFGGEAQYHNIYANPNGTNRDNYLPPSAGTFIVRNNNVNGLTTSATSIGSETKGVYVSANGVVNAMSYSVNKDVPANAKFTDTTYSFTNKAATLAWGTSTTIATVGGVDITAKLPANPNTDTKAQFSPTTTGGTHPLVFLASGTTATVTTTAQFAVNTYANASNGMIYSYPSTGLTVNGSSGFHWGGSLASTGTTARYGYVYALSGTTSTVGVGYLVLGNTTPSGTNHNAKGMIQLYGNKSSCAKIVFNGNEDTERVCIVPDVANSSEFLMTAGAQTITGNKTFGAATYFGGGTTYYWGSNGSIVANNIVANGYATVKGQLNLVNKIIGNPGAVSSGNYTTTVPTAAGTAGQIMFVIQS